MKKIFIIISSLILTTNFAVCKNKDKIITEKEKFAHKSASDINLYIQQVNQQKNQALTGFVQSLSLEEKISQLFIENINGNSNYAPVENICEIQKKSKLNKPDTISQNKKIVPGGYLFFGFNLGEKPEDIMKFTDSISQYCMENNQIPPFLAVDQEGGFVNRLRNISGPLPSQQRVSECLSPNQAYSIYEMQANQMKLLGFNMNLSPVIEICTEDNKEFLNQRSFGDKEKVISYGKECVNAYQKNQISTVLKHFPGNTNTDPHSGLPEIKLSEEDLYKSTEPFKIIINENPSGILMSHARTSSIDNKTPACLSSIWVTEILRNKFNYQGIIFSDDIFMAALSKNGYPPEVAVVKAIEAGIDCIMISEKRIAEPAVVLYDKAISDNDFLNKINEAVTRIIVYKMNSGLLELKENHGKYSIEIVSNNKEPLAQRIETFEKIKNENIKLYQDYF